MSHAFSALAAKVLQNDLVSRSGDESRIGVVNSVGGMQECVRKGCGRLCSRVTLCAPRARSREEEFASEEAVPEGKAWISWLASGSVLHDDMELVDVSELSVRAIPLHRPRNTSPPASLAPIY